MEPISTPAPVPEPEAQAAPPTIHGANGQSAAPLPAAAVEAALAAPPPSDGILDLDAMVASWRDGKWYELPIGGRFRVRATTIAARMYRDDLEQAYRAANGLLAPGEDGKLPPIPKGDAAIIGIKVIRDHRISDFDRFRLGGAPLPNRTPDGSLHKANLDILLSLLPVQGATFGVLAKADAEAEMAMAADQGNLQGPSPTN